MRAHLVLTLALVAACGGDDAPRAPRDAAPAPPVPGVPDADNVRLAQSCLDALGRGDTLWSDACRAIYREPACRDTWNGADPDTAAHMAANCALAYCVLLPKPRPWACTHPYRDPMDGWPELSRAILSYELGPVVAAPILARITPRDVHVEIEVRPTANVVASVPYSDEQLEGLLHGLPPDTTVVVTASSQIPYARVLEVLGRVEAAGLRNVSVQVQ